MRPVPASSSPAPVSARPEPPPLPAAQYDDLNHPSAEGYRALAERLWVDPQFRAVLLDAAE